MKKNTAALLILLFYLLGIVTPYAGSWTLRRIFSHPGEEWSRKTSPDGVLDAVVIENNPGAMSSFVYYLYVLPKGRKVNEASDAWIVNTSEGGQMTVDWERPHFLTVHTGNSHVKWFGNLWYSEKVPDYYVELTLDHAGKHYLQEDGRLRGSH